jgi:rhodanese-related sulfurtransferase
MKAVTVEPRKPDSARLEDVPDPEARDGSMLVEAIAVGVCGTDVEIVEGKYGWAPPGKSRLVLGHESLGRVIDPGPSSQLKRGDLVVGIVRRPDPVPCPNCAVGEWDMCRNGQYTERGIKEIDGFMSERWRTEPEFTIKVDPSLGLLGVLLEPTTVVTKALEHVAEIGRRSLWEPRTVLVTGAGPIGLLAALIAKQHGKEVHILDRMESGPKPDVVRALGATDFEKIYLYPNSHTGYYPGAKMLAIKVLFRKSDGRLLGAQVLGKDGVAARVNAFAMAIQMGGTMDDLEEAKLCYAPPFGSAKDPVNFAGMVATDVLRGYMPLTHWQSVDNGCLLDVRHPPELAVEQVPGALNIPLPELRARLGELPRDRKILVFCRSGQRAYYGTRILLQNGFRARNVAGGMLSRSHAVLSRVASPR